MAFQYWQRKGEKSKTRFLIRVQDKNTKEPFPIEEKRAIRASLAARRKRMIIRPLGDVIVFMPPLGCPTEDLENMLAILYASIVESRSPREVTKEAGSL